MNDPTAEDTGAGRPWWRRELRYFVEIAAVAGFAVAQPILGSFGESPETFVMAGASRTSIVLFALLVVLLPPFLVWAVAALAGLAGSAVRRASQGMAIGLFAALLGQWALRGPLSGIAVTVVAVAVGALVAFAYSRVAALRLYLSFASVAPVAFVVVFLAFSAVTPLVITPGGASASGSAAAAPSVVLLVLDELPTASLLDAGNQIDANLFPNLARLAGDANFYRNNTTVATHTDAALPGLLTGRHPLATKAARRDYSQNLFSLLADSHDLNVHEAVTALCTADGCDRAKARSAITSLADRAWELWTDLLTGDSSAAPEAGPVLSEASSIRFEQPRVFVDSLESEGDAPRFDFGHLLLPHQQWEVLPSGTRYTSEVPYPSQLLGAFTTDTGAELARQRHLLQLQYADGLVGDMLDRLEETGRYDDSYVIVTSDHGVAFAKDELNRGGVLTEKSAPQVLWAPLLVKAPDQTDGVVSDENTQSIDVLPTIADAMGVDIPWEVDGRSLLGEPPLPAGDKRYLPTPLEAEKDRYEGKTQRVDGVEGYEAMLALPPAADGDSSDPLALFRRAPYEELTNTLVVDLPQGPPADLEVRLDEPERYDDVDLDAEFLPLYVSGEIDGPNPEDSRVVVSVNGVIGGWSGYEVDWQDPDWQTRFAVLVPESLLRSGRNTIEVFAISGEPGSVTLHPVDSG